MQVFVGAPNFAHNEQGEYLTPPGRRDYPRLRTDGSQESAPIYRGLFLLDACSTHSWVTQDVIKTLRQRGRRTIDYVTEFKTHRNLLTPADRTSDWTFAALWDGLDARIQAMLTNEIARISMGEQKVSKLITHLEELDRGQSMMTVHVSSFRAPAIPVPGPSIPTTTSAQAAHPPAKADPDAMDVDRARYPPPRKDAVCYNCGQKGHYKSACKKLAGRGYNHNVREATVEEVEEVQPVPEKRGRGRPRKSGSLNSSQIQHTPPVAVMTTGKKRGRSSLEESHNVDDSTVPQSHDSATGRAQKKQRGSRASSSMVIVHQDEDYGTVDPANLANGDDDDDDAVVEEVPEQPARGKGKETFHKCFTSTTSLNHANIP